MKKYGYVFSPGKSLLSFAVMFSITLLLGRFFGLGIAAQSVLAAAGAVLFPFFLRNTYKNRYQQKKFSDLNIYMEQFLYSFQKTGKVLMTLKDVSDLFGTGDMKKAVDDAIYHIEHTYDERDVARNALAIIEGEYKCDELIAIHSFALRTEEVGGEYARSIALLLESRRMWADRVYALMQMKKKKRSDIVLSIITSLLLCAFVYYMSGRMGVDVSESVFSQVITVVTLILDLLIYYLADRKLVGGFFDEDEGGMDDSEAAEAFKRYYGYGNSLFAGIAKGSLRKRLSREIEKSFPQWLMQLSLLLQSENVEMALIHSYEQAPSVIKPALLRMTGMQKLRPGSKEPYLDFLSEFGLPEVGSTMKMLYSISEGSGGDAAEQIADIVRRNRQMTERAKRLKGEDSVAGMYALFLAPQLTGGAKIMADMILIFTVYMGKLV